MKKQDSNIHKSRIIKALASRGWLADGNPDSTDPSADPLSFYGSPKKEIIFERDFLLPFQGQELPRYIARLENLRRKISR